MAKKPKKRRQFTLPIAVVAPIGLSFFLSGKAGWGGSPYAEAMSGRWKEAADHLLMGWLGISPEGRFDMQGMKYLKMTLIGTIIHWVASKVGVNRYLGRARVPILRI